MARILKEVEGYRAIIAHQPNMSGVVIAQEVATRGALYDAARIACREIMTFCEEQRDGARSKVLSYIGNHECEFRLTETAEELLAAFKQASFDAPSVKQEDSVTAAFKRVFSSRRALTPQPK
jgi:hypothetical protein